METETDLFLEFSKREQKELDILEETEKMLAVPSILLKKAQKLVGGT
jgi:hypothetical protein